MDNREEFSFIDKKYMLDKRLYKYFSNKKYAVDCIKNKRVHLDNPYDYNDPFDDGVFNGGVGCDGKEGAHINGILKWGKLSCFSEVSDSILMWSYYGDKHKGICIEFDLELLDEADSLNKRIKENISKVQYSPIRPHGDIFDIDDNSNFVYTKADVWAHECEWRIICDTKKEFLPFDCVSGIILGESFVEYGRFYKQLINLAKKERINLKKCELSLDQYKLEFKSIYSVEDEIYEFIKKQEKTTLHEITKELRIKNNRALMNLGVLKKEQKIIQSYANEISDDNEIVFEVWPY